MNFRFCGRAASEETNLCHQHNHAEEETQPRAVDSTGSSERNLVQGVTVVFPGFTESNVSYTDRAPSKEGGETGNREQPREDDGTSGAKTDKGNKTKENNDNDREQRSARFINVCEDLRRISLLRKCSKSSRASINGGDTDGHDGDKDDQIHKVVKSVKASVFTDEHKRRCLGVIVSTGIQQRWVRVIDKQADEEETQDIEEGDSPEDLFDGAGHSLDGIARLCCSKTDKFSTGKGERSRDEDGAESLEAVLKGTWVVPVAGTPVLIVSAARGAAAANKNQGNDHEDDNGDEFK